MICTKVGKKAIINQKFTGVCKCCGSEYEEKRSALYNIVHDGVDIANDYCIEECIMCNGVVELTAQQL